jgi:hypothetical protein
VEKTTRHALVASPAGPGTSASARRIELEGGLLIHPAGRGNETPIAVI